MTLELRSLNRQVGSENHLRDVSLTIETGTFNVLLGPAHAGKTSILRSVAGLDLPDSGSIHFHGNDITSLQVRKRNVAFVYQEFVNYPMMSVFENIASPMRVAARPKREIESTVAEIAALLDITELLERRPPSLSGGQQQRVALARALARDADIVLLDEPLANLDYKLREDLRRELPRIFAGTDKIILYATTDPDEAFLLGGTTIVLNEGAVCQVGPASEIFAAPSNLIAAGTISEFPLNLIPMSFKNNTLSLNNGHLFPAPMHMRSLSNGKYTLGFRAEHLGLQANASAVECDATVSVTEKTGNETIVHLMLANQHCVAIVDASFDAEPGHSLKFFLDLDNTFVFNDDGQTIATPGYPQTPQTPS